MRPIAIVLTVGCLALAGCAVQLAECRKAYPPGSAGYQSCLQDELRRENAEADRQLLLNRRGKE